MILALHGFTGRGTDFAPLTQLVPYAWSAPDLHGHGPKPKLDCSPEAIINFIEQQRHLASSSHQTSPDILLGYSMGARATLLHAVHHPKSWDALILISPNPGIEAAPARQNRAINDEILAERLEKRGVNDFLKYWIETPIIKSQKNIRPDWFAQMQAARTEHTSTGLASSLRQFGQGNIPNLWPRLKQLDMPILLLTGELDEQYCDIAEKMDTLLPHSTREVITNSGHMPHMEQAQNTASAINKFLISLSEKTKNLRPSGDP